MENLNSIASLFLVVIVNEGEDDDSDETGQNLQQQQKRKRLWGTMVFHNKTRRKYLYKLPPLEEVLFDIEDDDFVEKPSGKPNDAIGTTIFRDWDPDKIAKFLNDKKAMFRSLVP
ncbi:Phytochrome A [Dendrobium catenatum]|uniref:Phytochrome A n=1 Tax=Dendrobium catenatum TaxID=906689 RepID=A0A2I0XGU3_9ASPA|nr:Phytochrome A [Dendrobium catenatum]